MTYYDSVSRATSIARLRRVTCGGRFPSTLSRRRKAAETTSQYLDDWLVSQHHRLRPTTVHSYRLAIARINTWLGKVPLQSLTPLQIERFYADLLREGGHAGQPLSPKTVRNSHVLLRKALADAERLGLVQRNAAAAARPPSSSRRESSPHGRRRTYVSSSPPSGVSGLRCARRRRHDRHASGDRSAALARSRSRRCAAQRRANPDRGERRGGDRPDEDVAEPAHGVPRPTDGRRATRAPPATTRGTADRRSGLGGSSTYLEFRDEVGVLLHPGLVHARVPTAQPRLALPPIRLHDLRHTYATLALKAGIHPKVVSERLGHATVGITLDLYSHVTPAIARDAANVVAQSIFE